MKLRYCFTLFIFSSWYSLPVQAQDTSAQTQTTRERPLLSSNPLTPYADAYASLGFPWLYINAELTCSYSKPRLLTRTSYSVKMTDADHVFIESNGPGVECECKLFAYGCEWGAVSKPDIPCPYGQAQITGPNAEPAGTCPNEIHKYKEELIASGTLWLDIDRLMKPLEIDRNDHQDLRSLSYEVCERWCDKAAENEPSVEDQTLLTCPEPPPTINYAQYFCATAQNSSTSEFHQNFGR